MSNKYYFSTATLKIADEYGEADTIDLYGDEIERVRKVIVAAERAENNVLRTLSAIRFG